MIFSLFKRLQVLLRQAKPRHAVPPSQGSSADNAIQAAYVEGALKKIRAGHPHASLGGNLSEESKQEALDCFRYLAGQGIKSSDVVVDYGCGTLRIGRHFIDFLNPENYVGMDLDDRILEAGATLLLPTSISEKKPKLITISKANVEKVAILQPAVVFAKGVLQHVPPQLLNEFFANLSTLGKHGEIIVTIKNARESRRLSNRSWIYTRYDILAAAAQCGMKLIKTNDRWHHFIVDPNP